MMWLFGFAWGIVNLFVGYFHIQVLANGGQQRSRRTNTFTLFLIVFVALPVYTFLVIMPFFGGWIVTPIVQKVRMTIS